MTHLGTKEPPAHPQFVKQLQEENESLKTRVAFLENALEALDHHPAAETIRKAAAEAHLSEEKKQFFAEESMKFAHAMLSHLDARKKG